MHWLDYVILGTFLIALVAIGARFRSRAGADLDSFFLSNRSLPWYFAGCSMIATGFACDTPLWITTLVRKHGLAAAWQFWTPVIGAALGVALFSRLWRRSGVTTDFELIELRYSGPSAACLRGVSATMFAFLLIPLMMGWVIRAMGVISQEAIGIPEQYEGLVILCIVISAVVVCAASGLYGVVYTDFILLLVASVGSIVLAVLAVNEVGGLSTLVQSLRSHDEWIGADLKLMPTVGDSPRSLSPWNAIGYFGLVWWIVAQSGGFQAQRIFASKDSREAARAQLLHTVVYYGVLAWPWIIVALCSVVLFPDLSAADQDAIYPRMIVRLLPVGLRGLVVAAMVAAFVSTISTLFNWASSYLVNDFYKRFVKGDASGTHYVMIARLATVTVASIGGFISLYTESLQQLIEAYLTIALATNLLAVLRWFWWRQNAWGELSGIIAAWVAAFLMLQIELFDGPFREVWQLPDSAKLSSDYQLLGARMLLVMLMSLAVSLAVSLLTPETDTRHLQAFLLRTKTFAFGWRPVIAQMPTSYTPDDRLRSVLWHWVVVLVCAAALILTIGLLILGNYGSGALALCVFVVALAKAVALTNRHNAPSKTDPA